MQKSQSKRSKKQEKINDTSTLEPALYVVSTPIGNPMDWTIRAQMVLNEADVVAAEDTRVTKTMLSKLNLSARRLISYHEHNETESAPQLLEYLQAGKSVALVSDAGTPMISDPGFKIVRMAYETGIRIIPIPGVSSLTTALSISPMGGGSAYFAGFLPSQTKARQDYLRAHSSSAHQLIFFEAPHRIKETMADLEMVFGADQEILVCRELTKSFEENLFKTCGEMKKYFSVNEPRGEFVIIVKGLPEARLNKEETKAKAIKLYQQGLSASDIVENLQPVSELPRKEIYDIVLSVKKAT